MNAFIRIVLPALLAAVPAPTVLARQSPTEPPPVAGSPSERPAGEPADAKDANDGVDATEESRLRREVNATVETIRSYSAERRDGAVRSAARAIADLDRQMRQLQQQMDRDWQRMGAATRRQSQATMAGLRDQRTALAEWYGGMRHGSTAAWEEVRTGFLDSYGALADALRDARAKRSPADAGGEEAPANGTPEPAIDPAPEPAGEGDRAA